ncbi:MAG TPA: hypothetical protein VF116_00340 [Ktedonobacterales bacterium]
MPMPRDPSLTGHTPGGHPVDTPTRSAGARRRLDLAGMAAALLDEIAQDQDERWGGGRISASAYEAAWVALVRHPEDPQRLAFPAALDWLLRHQRRGGGWGPPFPHGVIPSMAALLALHRAPEQTDAVRLAVARGLRALRGVLPRWRAEAAGDTPFFEFLIPTLAAELERHGIHLDIPDLDLMLARRDAKLARLPLDALYTGRSSLVHALEVLGPALDYPRLRATCRAPNGAYGCSPSATAAVLLHAPEWDSAAAAWLRHLEVDSARAGDPGAMATSHPADVFEAAWTLHLLRLGGFAVGGRPPGAPTNAHSHGRILTWLRGALTADGAGFSRLSSLPCDADDTALTLAVLNESGVRSDLAPLNPFARDSHYVSYEGERTASTSTNAHALDALLSVDTPGAAGGRPPDAPTPHASHGGRPPDAPTYGGDHGHDRHTPDASTLAERCRRVARYLLEQGSPEGCWEDKWHISPYYATLSCALALARYNSHIHRIGNGEGAGEGGADAELAKAVRVRLDATLAWLVQTQRRGGGWGIRGATLEETAYGALTVAGLLRLAARQSTQNDRSMLQKARGYLRRHLSNLLAPDSVASLPTMWVDKTLYAPPRVIRAAVLAALHSPLGA